jgi:hypothetical protein
MRRIITVTPGIAEALASIFTLRPHITAIGTAVRDTSIIGITAGIVIGEPAQSPSTRVAGDFVMTIWSRNPLDAGREVEP